MGTIAGVVLSLVAGALLFWGFVLFVFYGFVGVALLQTNSETVLLLGAIVGVPLWVAATIAVTTRAGARRG